jgi:hypothetical protein
MIVNGIYFSFVDLVITMNAFQLSAVKSLNYKDSLGRNFVHGCSPIPLGLTTGHYEATGDIELYLPSATLIYSTPLWRTIPWAMTISYGPNVVAPLPFTTDVIPVLFLTELDAPQSDSEDAITRKFSFKIMTPILWNGVPGMVWTNNLGAIG